MKEKFKSEISCLTDDTLRLVNPKEIKVYLDNTLIQKLAIIELYVAFGTGTFFYIHLTHHNNYIIKFLKNQMN